VLTHAFINPEDPANGGTWYDGKGSRVCIWYWDAAKKRVTIVRGARGKRLDLSGIADRLLTPDELLVFRGLLRMMADEG